MWYHNSLNPEAYVRIQLSSTKPDFKENCKNVNNITFLNNLDLEMIAILIKTLFYINLLWACWYFCGFFFLVLIYNMVNS